jgi:nicotinate-nucleotide--dimethylbenzimidazole phosphoribosyltransferase
VASIQELDNSSMEMARHRLDSLTKPQGSLGLLEEIAVKLAGICRGVPVSEPKTVIVLVGDHGIAGEGVSAYPQEVTCQMVRNFLTGGAAINVLARLTGAHVAVVDMGVLEEIEPHENMYIYRVREGTANIANGPAMSREEAAATVEAGIEVAGKEIKKGCRIIAIGEMGIGNTSAASAILSVLTGYKVERVTGVGTGVNQEGLQKKITLVNQAVNVNLPNPNDPLDVLSKVGGLEIGGMVGVILGAAAAGVPVVVDGFVSGAAAMLAMEMAPLCSEYLFFSHLSAEAGHKVMLDWLKKEPLLRLNMRLGEGTGAVLAFPIFDAAVKIFEEMATFQEAGISVGNEKGFDPETEAKVFNEFWKRRF